jgi:uncharacterized protein YerC
MRSRNDLRKEAMTRAAVLYRNAGGTYRAAENMSGISAQTISAWRRGLRTPRSDYWWMLRVQS